MNPVPASRFAIDAERAAIAASAIAQALGRGEHLLRIAVASHQDCWVIEQMIADACGSTRSIAASTGHSRLHAVGGLGIPTVPIQPTRIDPSDLKPDSQAVSTLLGDLFGSQGPVIGILSAHDGIDDHVAALLRLIVNRGRVADDGHLGRLVVVTRARAASVVSRINQTTGHPFDSIRQAEAPLQP